MIGNCFFKAKIQVACGPRVGWGAGLLTGLNEIERDLIRERTQDSINHRRKTGGNLGGRPKTSDKRADLVLSLRDQCDSYRTIRDKTQMGYSTIRRIIIAADEV